MMADAEKREKVVKGLECCIITPDFCRDDCPYIGKGDENDYCDEKLFKDALAMLKSLSAFKEYFDGLYGQGLDVANYHLNGATEPFDNFYDSAMEEYENARCD